MRAAWCSRSRDPGRPHQERTAQKLHASWTELDLGHYAMLSHPREITEYLLSRSG